MSHTKHHTDAYVLGGINTGEADKFLWLYTREFGLVGVQTKSLRKVSSKQRFALQDYSFSHVSLVKGRNLWRLTNVSPGENLYQKYIGDQKLGFIIGLFSLVKRLIQGEEKDREVFSLLEEAMVAIDKVSNNMIKDFEKLVYLRVLFLLGYIDDDVSIKFLIEDLFDFSDARIASIEGESEKLQKLIDKALLQSQL